MTIAETAFAALDFESAGLRRGGTEAPVQIGIAQMRGLVLRPEENFTSYLFSDQPITWMAQKVHGIRSEDLVGAPSMAELWPEIKNRLQNRWVVAHGAATEKRYLRAFPFHGFGPWVDTLKLARALWPGRKSFALGELITDLGMNEEPWCKRPRFRWHDALSDAEASLALLQRVVNEADIGGEDAEILLRPNDARYHRLKAKSFPAA
ncbi:hypothetical protein BH09VER1_BH09VER1_49990 [soil metagenome]